MKILIIGSEGFIGKHCVRYFSQKNDVWACDVGIHHDRKKYFQVDSTNADFSEIFSDNNFDICINCSGAASVPDSISDPQRDFILNTNTVLKQLEVIKKYNPDCKYIHISSAAVYGNPNQLPIKENHPLAPISPYGKHKKMAEEIVKEFFELRGIKACSLRVFSAYGPGLKKQIFWDLYQKQKKSNNVKLFGTGNESRDYIYIADLVHAIDCVIKNGKFNGDAINVASGKKVTIKNAASIFFKYFNPSINISFGGEERKGDPINLVADIEELKSLEYSPQVSIEKGILKYVEWLKEQESD